MRLPWLHYRKRLFFYISIEFIIIFLTFFHFLKINLFSEYSFYVFFYTWIIIGYVRGRYSKTKFINFKTTFFKEIKDIFFTILILFLINNLIFTVDLFPPKYFIL